MCSINLGPHQAKSIRTKVPLSCSQNAYKNLKLFQCLARRFPGSDLSNELEYFEQKPYLEKTYQAIDAMAALDPHIGRRSSRKVSLKIWFECPHRTNPHLRSSAVDFCLQFSNKPLSRDPKNISAKNHKCNQTGTYTQKPTISIIDWQKSCTTDAEIQKIYSFPT